MVAGGLEDPHGLALVALPWLSYDSIKASFYRFLHNDHICALLYEYRKRQSF